MTTMLIPHLVVANATEAIEFYKKAFNAVEEFRLTAPDGKRLLHARLKIGLSLLMLADDFPEYCGGKSRSPLSLPMTPVTLHLYVPNVDAAFDQAVDAGAKVAMPVADMFWGDRYGMLLDPFGHSWSLATPKQNLTPEQMAIASKTACVKADQQMQSQQ